MHPVFRRTASPLVAAAVLVAVAACSTPSAPAASLPTARPTTSKATPSARASSTADSAATTTPSAAGTVIYKVTGSGTAITVDWTPSDAQGNADRKESVPLPWTQQVPDSGTASVYEVVVVGGNNVGCTITVGGKVVAQEPAGGSAHCVYQP